MDRWLAGLKGTLFLSTLSLRRATVFARELLLRYQEFLSTLSLRRATLRHCTTYLNCSHFYPRSPCGERLISTILCLLPTKFLSTLSLRRATRQIDAVRFARFDFYPRSPCGERPTHVIILGRKIAISIHALLAESDGVAAGTVCAIMISIHALLAESDTMRAIEITYNRSNFYPRSPCGERLSTTTIITCTALFLSTLSLRRATAAGRQTVILII